MIKNPIIRVFTSLAYNIKPLLLFEVLYRLLGFFVIYPLVRLIFHLAIELSGYRFITNTILIDFLLKPTTMLLVFVLLIILSIYMVIELTFLAVLFDLGYRNQHIRFTEYLLLGLKKVSLTFLKYNVLIIIPSFFFLFVIQAAHIVGIASTINIPPYIIAQLRSMPTLSMMIYIFIVLSLVIFIETIFSIHLFTIDRMDFKHAYKESRLILKKNRLKMIGEFILINVIINIVLYGIYLIVIILIGVMISMIRGQEYVLGFLLTVLYSTYSFIGIFATLIIVPINFALISTWYYRYKSMQDQTIIEFLPEKINVKSLDLKWVKRGTFITLIVLFILNITTIFSLLLEPTEYVEILHQMDIVAHRGASKDAPENTISSIALAIEQGADVVEFDIQLTKDHVIVLMHDYTLRRTTDFRTTTRLDSLNYADIAQLDAGSWFSDEFTGEKIPTLIEVLAFIDGRMRIFIDIKTNSSILDEQLVQTLEIFNMVDKSVVLSKNRSQLARIKALNPDIKTLLLISSFYGDQTLLANDPVVDYYGLEQRFVVNSLGMIKDLQSKGKKVYAWTVTETNDMERMMRFGLDGMITARPYIAREVVYSYRTSQSLVDILRQLFES